MADQVITRKRCTADYAYPFAQWDLRLYLDTHPDDREAFAYFRTLCEKMPDTYACHGTMAPDGTCDHWHWIEGPWPWEFEANAIDGKICSCNDSCCDCQKGGR